MAAPHTTIALRWAPVVWKPARKVDEISARRPEESKLLNLHLGDPLATSEIFIRFSIVKLSPRRSSRADFQVSLALDV